MFDDNDGLIDDNVVFESEVRGMPHRSERIFSGIGLCDTKRSRSTSQMGESSKKEREDENRTVTSEFRNFLLLYVCHNFIGLGHKIKVCTALQAHYQQQQQ